MDLPNYFLADLPDASTLTPELITEACRALKRNRERFLERVTTDSIIQVLTKLASDWLDSESPFRKLVIAQGPAETGFSRETLASGLDRFFSQITSENLRALIAQDLGSQRRLDEFVADATERTQERNSIARGPELLVQITGGVLPNPTLTSLMLGLIARSAQFIKCPAGSAFIPRMFAHSLYAVQPKLGACLEIAAWPGGSTSLETALFEEATVVAATGSDETLGAIRARLPAAVRFIGYGHRLSFAYITREALEKLDKVAASVADDIIAWNQLGCLSPQAVYVENGGSNSSEQFGAALAEALGARERTEPRGPVSAEAAAAIATGRMFYEVRASADPATVIWSSPGSTAWTVVHDNTSQFQTSCLHRFIHIKPVESVEGFLATLEPLRGHISTAGLAGPMPRLLELASSFSRVGITRLCRVGSMQHPPLAWRHDGRPSLGELITWTDLEL